MDPISPRSQVASTFFEQQMKMGPYIAESKSTHGILKGGGIMQLLTIWARYFAAALLIGLIWPSSADAQRDPIRWGNIPDEHFDLDVYPADSTAAALVLADYGTLDFRQDLLMTHVVHRRVKIFSEAGYDLATVQLVYRHADGHQTLRRLEGQTFIRGVDGRVQRVRLDSDDIFREVDGNVTRVRFTLPSLEPGAIFEYRYTLVSRSAAYFPDWTFQDVVPTLHSEFRANVPRYLIVDRFAMGAPDFSVQEIDERPFNIDEFIQFGGNRSATRREIYNNTYRWVMNDVEALPEESYVASRWDHAHALRFQTSGYIDRFGDFNSLSRSWADVAFTLLDSDVFGRRYRPSASISRGVAQIVADASSPGETATAIYDFVRGTMVWDGRYRFLAERSLPRVLESRSGSSGEINLLLLSMLRAADVNAYPVLVSTRRNGRAQPFYVSTSQFNHVIVRATIQGENVFFDATDPHRPANMLPVPVLNHEGLEISEQGVRWLPLEPAPGTMSAVSITGSITDSGSIEGNITARLAGYSALQARQRLAEEDDEDAGDSRAVGASDALQYRAVSVTGVEGDGHILFSGEFLAPEPVHVLGHLMSFNPVLQGRLDDAPFRQQSRHYPVDFTHPRHDIYEARLFLPDGYVIDELPAVAESVLPNGGGVFQRIVHQEGNQLVVQRQFVLAKHIFEPAEYPALKAFYEAIAEADAEVVVLIQEQGSAEGPTEIEGLDQDEEG